MTHYDTLGVPPGADRTQIERAFFDLSHACLPTQPHGWTSMKYAEHLRNLIRYSEAMLVLHHSDRREAYDRKLRESLEVCCLCDGKGWVGMGRRDIVSGASKQRMPCAACRSTGKSEPAPKSS